MLSVIYAECRKQAHYVECHYDECRCAEFRRAQTKVNHFCSLKIDQVIQRTGVMVNLFS
jgi:hypothetical protein